MTDSPLSTPDPDTPKITRLSGIPVFPGIAFGFCQHFSANDLEIPQFAIDKAKVRGEIQRLRAAITTVDKQLTALMTSEDEDLPTEAIAFIDVQRAILRDQTLIEKTIEIIREKLVNAEWALSLQLEKTRREFESIEDEYIRERISDVTQVFARVQRVLTGRRSTNSLLEAEGVDTTIILIADQLDPADMLLLRNRDDLDIAGIVLEEGSITSHTTILARSLEIPTLVGVKHAKELLINDQPLLLNTDEKVLELNPTPEQKRQARSRMRTLAADKRLLKKIKNFDAVTLDGHAIRLYANIALPEDVKDVHRVGADGVGLFRTEFLFMNRDDLPSEEEQVNAYSRVIRSMKGQPVIIRTADLGGDKTISSEALAKCSGDVLYEQNPSLGLRALRFSFAHPRLFLTQIRAILRAAVCGSENVKILLPMITSPEDIEAVRQIITQAKAQLTEENIKFADNVPLGGMIEVPAAFMMIRELIPVLDFFSLGTNDLVQYTLAVDRNNATVSNYYDERHPSVLRMIAQAIKQVHLAGKSISVCGEMAGRKELVPFFIGLGCTSLSMASTQIPSIKQRILKTDRAKAENFVASVLRKRSIKAVHHSFNILEDSFQNPTHLE